MIMKMKVIRERHFESDVTVLIADKGEMPLLVCNEYGKTSTIKNIENHWMINNGYERVAGHNCGFFIMGNNSFLGQAITDWGSVFSSETGYKDGIADVAYDGNKIKVGDFVGLEGNQWVRTASWLIMKDGVKNTLGQSKYSHANSYQPRTMIGKTKDGYPISFVVDGRGVASKIKSGATSRGVTANQQYELAKIYNCSDLVNLDGGGSSVMEYKGDILNNPSDGALRKCTDFIIYYAKKEVNNNASQGDNPNTNTGGSNMNKFKLVLDAGHGMNTAGKRTPDDVREWYMNDRVCDFIEEKLRAYEGVEVFRTDDISGKTDIALSERVARCNKINPDVMVSIHHNATGADWADSVTGTEVFWHTRGTKEDERLAKIVAPKLSAHTGLRNRGVKQEAWAVLGCRATAILVEGGFMNSRIDHPVITSWGMESYADAIVESLVEAYGLVKTKLDEPQVEPVAPEVESEKPTNVPTDPTKQYRVIAGTYSVRENAERIKQELVDKGYTGTWLQAIDKN